MRSALEIVLIFLASSVAVVWLARKAKLPPLLGYLFAGILIGPFGFGWVPDSKEARYLAEFGVVFLMFSIGLEFSLPKLKAMRSTLFGLGLAQVALSIGVAVGAALLLGLGWKTGIALGAALAMSSTAIVVKLLAERRELETPHGRDILGVLLFQDLAVVPILILIPALEAPPEELLFRIGLALLKATAVLVLLLTFGQKIMRAWFHLVAKRQSSELFMLNLLLVALGLAWVTEEVGLSLALGAFVAGMLISETEYRHQVEEDIKAFRDVLLGLFFVGIGMLLNLQIVWDHIGLVLFLAVVPVLGKFALVAGLGRLFRRETGVSVRTALGLAQAGEFGFVILNLSGDANLIDEHLMPLVLAAMILSMIAAPFIIMHGEKIVARVTRSAWVEDDLTLHDIVTRTIRVKKHVIIAGYGRHGQALARMLKTHQVDSIALDLEPDRIREANAAGENVAYGDASRRETLMAAGLARAAAVVVSYADTEAALRILDHVRTLRPGLPVIVRTHDETGIEALLQAGASEVVADAFENSLMLASHALLLVGVAGQQVVRSVRDARESRYGLLRGFFSTSAEDDDKSVLLTHLHSIVLKEGAAALGSALPATELLALGATVVSVRFAKLTVGGVGDQPLAVGDVVVLKGLPAALAKAEQRLLKG